MPEIDDVKLNGILEEKKPVTTYDLDEAESLKQVRPAFDTDQDIREDDRRQPVDMIMNSEVFREELERIIESKISERCLPANSDAVQEITQFLLPKRHSFDVRSSHCLIPINDIRGVDSTRFSREERLLRCKLASLYRLIDLYGWSQNIYNHVTVRVSQDLEHFLLNPFGLQYPEVTASSLLKVDTQGNVLDPGSTSFTFNRAGFVIHSAVHACRPDVHCCIHVHHPSIVAVSAMKVGLLPISQEAAILGGISYHDYQGIAVDTKEREQITRDLGPTNHVMLLRNHGCMVLGRTIEEALFYLQNLVLACETQVKLMPIGLDNIQVMSDEARKKVRSIITENQSDVIGKPMRDCIADDEEDTDLGKFRVWDLEFEAQMRSLDSAGFRTGYTYKFPLLRTELPRPKNEVSMTATLYAQYLDEDKTLSPLKKLMSGKKSNDKMQWINSPNVYQKEEILESGTHDPQKIAKEAQMKTTGEQVVSAASKDTKNPFD